MSSRGAYKLGAVKGKGSSTRMYYFCKQTSSEPWNCIEDFINIEPTPVPNPVPGKMKTVFLLELTAGYTINDVSVQSTLNYYWNTYPQEFTKCSIVDTQGSLEVTLQLLEEYYDYGFRKFVGFSRSTILNGVLDWFNMHPEAIGISATSSDPTLKVPKQIYRMTPSDDYMIDSIKTYLENKTVHYIYSSNENAPTNLIPYIQAITGISLSLVPITSVDDFTDPSFQSTINGYSSTDVILFYALDGRDTYISLFSDSGPLQFTGQQYDLLGIVAPTIETDYLADTYNTVAFKGISTSILWRNGYNTLLSNDFSIVTVNILNLLNTFLNNEIIDNINSHYGTLQFDPVTKDLSYSSFLIQTFVGANSFNNTSLYVQDPYLGEYNATFVGSSTISTDIIPVAQNKQFNGKAIALLDIEFATQTDDIINQSLYYFWSKDSTLPKFPIVDISNLTALQVVDILNTNYSEGYRVFLGPNQSNKLSDADILNWFDGHPDATCISIISAVTIPNIPKNIYRLNYNQTQVLGTIIKLIDDSTGVYYIGDNDALGLSVDQYLSNYCSTHIPVIPYSKFIIGVDGSLTVANILSFLGPATSTRVVPLLLNTNLQNYLNLYNDSLLDGLQPSQYISTNFISITVPDSNSLDNKLYTIGVTQSNTSNLWNQNREYLSSKYSSVVSSYELLNALKMIQYILIGKDVSLLGSHAGTLQFSKDLAYPNEYNNILFPSILLRKYSVIASSFNNFEIIFNDALLGNFSALF